MSVLSTIEIIYFFTIRLYANFRNLKSNHMKPKTFAQRIENVNISSVSTLKVPRLDTAKSSHSDISSMRMTAMSHY